MGWLRRGFRNVRRELASRAVLTDPLTQLRAAHRQEPSLGQTVYGYEHKMAKWTHKHWKPAE
jgi:hypothetical protein